MRCWRSPTSAQQRLRCSHPGSRPRFGGRARGHPLLFFWRIRQAEQLQKSSAINGSRCKMVAASSRILTRSETARCGNIRGVRTTRSNISLGLDQANGVTSSVPETLFRICYSGPPSLPRRPKAEQPICPSHAESSWPRRRETTNVSGAKCQARRATWISDPPAKSSPTRSAGM